MPMPKIFDYVEGLRVILTDGRELIFKNREPYTMLVHISDDYITIAYQTMGEDKAVDQYVIPMRNVLYLNRTFTLKEDSNAV